MTLSLLLVLESLHPYCVLFVKAKQASILESLTLQHYVISPFCIFVFLCTLSVTLGLFSSLS